VSKPAIDSLLSDLTDPQRRAVTHVDRPLLVIAAAGSGKTRVITRRVAYLIATGVPPASILAITFTNKAAGEMKHRISAASPRPIRDWGRLDQPNPTICTFHSLCLRILRHYAGRIGFSPNFSVYDSADQIKVVKEAMKALELDLSHFTPGTIHGTISNAKNKLLDPAAFAAKGNKFYEEIVAKVYVKYQQALQANNALDFDDLLMQTVEVLKKHPDILAELQERFRYILVDEYQDTNHAQYILAHAIAMKHRNICVVGDPDQSIYTWRGADIKNILDFEKDYPDAAVIPLEQNYRSTRNILAIADQLISYNLRRKAKRLWTENPQGEPATLLMCTDERDEALAVTEELVGLNRAGIPYNAMAIFYRMNSLSRVMEDALRRANVPYQIARGVEFYNRKEIKDVLAYLRLIANPSDAVNLARIVNVPTRGLGDSSLKLFETHAIASNISMWEALQSAGSVAGVSSRARNSAKQFVDLIESFRRNSGGSVQKIMEDVVRRSGLEAMLKKEDPDEENELANVNELISAAAEYDKEAEQPSLEDFLARVSLVSDADHMDGAGGSVTLMTLHAAKGLEFPVVVMIGLEEGCLPHSRARDDADQLEEERRLCFVGITRAQERLILSMAATRTIRGIRGPTVASQFLTQMPRELLNVRARADSHEIPPPMDELDATFQVGQRVRHPAFGVGKVMAISDGGSSTRAVVHFERFGPKVLILEHAHLAPA